MRSISKHVDNSSTAGSAGSGQKWVRTQSTAMSGSRLVSMKIMHWTRRTFGCKCTFSCDAGSMKRLCAFEVAVRERKPHNDRWILSCWNAFGGHSCTGLPPFVTERGQLIVAGRLVSAVESLNNAGIDAHYKKSVLMMLAQSSGAMISGHNTQRCAAHGAEATSERSEHRRRALHLLCIAVTTTTNSDRIAGSSTLPSVISRLSELFGRAGLQFGQGRSLLLCATCTSLQFERAVAYLWGHQRLRDAAHFAVALHHYGLLHVDGQEMMPWAVIRAKKG